MQFLNSNRWLCLLLKNMKIMSRISETVHPWACVSKDWLKTIYLPIDYHVSMKEKYVTSNELSLISNFTTSHHLYHKKFISPYYFNFNFFQMMIQSEVNSSLKCKISHNWLKQNICMPGTEHSYTYIGFYPHHCLVLG